MHLRRAVESYASRSTKGASGATKASTMFGPPARAPRKSFRSLRFQPSGQAGQSQSKHLLFQNPVAWRYSGGFEFVVCVVPTVASSCLLVVGFKRDLKIKPSRRLSSEALRPLSAGVRKIRRSPPRLFFRHPAVESAFLRRFFQEPGGHQQKYRRLQPLGYFPIFLKNSFRPLYSWVFL